MTAVDASPRGVLARRVRNLLSSRSNVREVAMFGGVSFMVDGRMAVAAGRDGDLLVRTDPADYDDLLERGAVPAQMGDQRPMGRGWLSVPTARIQADAELDLWVNVGIDSRDATR